VGDVGPQGRAGDPGQQGPSGQPGPRGQTGATGFTGTSGEKGLQGQPGSQGLFLALLAGQLSLPSLRGRYIKYRPVWLGLRRGALLAVKVSF